MTTLATRYEHDRGIWDGCATTYERQIVQGHPDVTAYEAFEHSFVDRLAVHLTRDRGRSLQVYDFGCGSGRLHRELAPLLLPLTADADHTVDDRRGGVAHVGGVDFSQQMIDIANAKLTEAGLERFVPERVSFDVGSAFEVTPYDGPDMPVAVSVCNSIGVMQGPAGAQELFAAMRRYVEPHNGLAVISCYAREAVQTFALGNYESTMDVCGQPCWLEPDTWASEDYTLVPRCYKRAHDPSPAITVDVDDREGNRVETGVTLTRNSEAVERVVATGEIETHASYHSRWYSYDQVRTWMREIWDGGTLWHIRGSELDRLRGEPAQLAVVDFSGEFGPLADTLDLHQCEQTKGSQ